MNWYKTAQQIITFDFDSTLTTPVWSEEEQLWVEGNEPNWDTITKLKQYAQQGYEIHIVTSRHENMEGVDDRTSVNDFIRLYRLPVETVHFTNGQSKGQTLHQLNSQMHHDDDAKDIESANLFDINTKKTPHPLDEN